MRRPSCCCATAAAGIEAWLLTRVAQMVFAAGMTRVPRRAGRRRTTPTCRGSAPAPAQFAARFGCDERLARALVGAAVRETFEETGVLLTVPAADLPRRARRRRGRPGAVRRRCCAQHGLAIDAARRAAVGALGHAGRARCAATTPGSSSPRCPTRAEAQDVTSESSVATWVPVRRGARAGRSAASGPCCRRRS